MAQAPMPSRKASHMVATVSRPRAQSSQSGSSIALGTSKLRLHHSARDASVGMTSSAPVTAARNARLLGAHLRPGHPSGPFVTKLREPIAHEFVPFHCYRVPTSWTGARLRLGGEDRVKQPRELGVEFCAAE